jgi:hypothetical protein
MYRKLHECAPPDQMAQYTELSSLVFHVDAQQCQRVSPRDSSYIVRFAKFSLFLRKPPTTARNKRKMSGTFDEWPFR